MTLRSTGPTYGRWSYLDLYQAEHAVSEAKGSIRSQIEVRHTLHHEEIRETRDSAA